MNLHLCDQCQKTLSDWEFFEVKIRNPEKPEPRIWIRSTFSYDARVEFCTLSCAVQWFHTRALREEGMEVNRRDAEAQREKTNG